MEGDGNKGKLLVGFPWISGINNKEYWQAIVDDGFRLGLSLRLGRRRIYLGAAS